MEMFMQYKSIKKWFRVPLMDEEILYIFGELGTFPSLDELNDGMVYAIKILDVSFDFTCQVGEFGEIYSLIKRAEISDEKLLHFVKKHGIDEIKNIKHHLELGNF